MDSGFHFETNSEKNRLTNIRISLRKSSGTFHRLPDGKRYGLLEWYPKAKRRQNKGSQQNPDDSELENDDESDEELNFDENATEP